MTSSVLRVDTRSRSRRRLPVAEAVVLVALALALTALSPSESRAQADDAGGIALAGAALGLASGASFGWVGALLPCDRTIWGVSCPTASGIAGGTIGLVAGGFGGAESAAMIRERGSGALYGVAIGSVVGVVMKQAVRQYAWNDALLIALYGAVVGTAPWGVLIGTGAGAVVGAVAWAGSPRGGWQDAILFAALGGAVGGLADWVYGAFDAQSGGVGVPVGFSIGVR